MDVAQTDNKPIPEPMTTKMNNVIWIRPWRCGSLVTWFCYQLIAKPASFIQSMTYEAGILECEEIPQTEGPVWILGKEYSALYDLDDIKHDIRSRLWFTYRKGFAPIGGTGPTTDTGWGCMLRCGQMMLAEALVMRHLGRDWKWDPDKYDPKYHEILRLFQDKKSSCYSIQQIASMGVSEGKSIGSWFGPNTIAQVLRKLSVYDEWSSVAIHVAMDNTVIMDDIETLCQIQCKDCHENDKKDSALGGEHIQPKSSTLRHRDISNGAPEPFFVKKKSKKKLCKEHWKPILIIIPLRLGLSEINPVYISSLKASMTLRQSVGIIGGKPNHAHWFIGYVDDELVFLDPHLVQPIIDLSQTGETDETYHCPCASRLYITQLDPSIALGFYCETPEDLADWYQTISSKILQCEKTPMFEIYQHRPAHWPPFQPYTGENVPDPSMCSSDERLYDTDEEFELL